MRGLGWAVNCAMFGAAMALSAPASAEITIAVNKTRQAMTVSIDGRPAYHWAVSTGTPGRDTPNGSYTVQRTARAYSSKKFDNSPMPNSMFFFAGYAIHGTPEEHMLGSPASHGCVRLSRANAQVLFALVGAQGLRNAHVLVTGETPSTRAVAQSMASSERLPVVLAAADAPQGGPPPSGDPRNDPRLDPRYDPRLNPYLAPPRRDAREPVPSPRRAQRDDRRPDPRLRPPPRRYADPRYDPRYDAPPPRRPREARDDPRRDPPRYSRPRPTRYDPYYDDPPRRPNRPPLRYEAARPLPPLPARSRIELLREYERLARRQAEIERELAGTTSRRLPPPPESRPYREPPRDYRPPPRPRYSDADLRR